MNVKRFWKNHQKKSVMVISVFGVLCIAYFIYLISGLPSLEQLENPKVERATKVYSVDGEVIDQFFIKNRSHVSLQEIPSTVINALIARHKAGVDVKVPFVVRLAGTNVEEGRKILAESGLELITAETLAEAASKAVQACNAAQEPARARA